MPFAISYPIILQSYISFFGGPEINNAGEIAGYGGYPFGVGGDNAISWQGSTATVLSPLTGFQYARAFGLNGSGAVVGFSENGSFSTQATEWVNGTAVVLAGEGYDSGAWAINDQGQAAGYATTDSSGHKQAVLWSNGAPILLGTLPGDIYAVAAAVNDADQVVGTSANAAGAQHAFLWQNGAMIALPTLSGGSSSMAMAINKTGEIVGWSLDSNGVQQAVLWINGTATELPGLSANGAAEAESINDNGQIVGFATTASGAKHAVLWQNGQIADLNSLLPNDGSFASEAFSRVTQASSINDSGQIVAGADGGPYITFSISSAAATVTASSAIQAYSANPQIGAEAVLDSGANVQASLDGLETLSTASKLLSITLGDPSPPTLSLTPAQLANDRDALGQIQGKFNLSIDASAPNLTIAGFPGGHGNTVQFQDAASDYQLAPSPNGGFYLLVTDTGTGRTSVDALSGVQALQFSDTTVIVAEAPTGNGVTSGSIAELYGAVFGREPDAGGLAFYESYLSANPSTPLLNFAQWLLGSSEYRSIAPSYTPDAAGDAHFITDLYNNLLHRTPGASDLAWYETNVITPALSGLTAGTTAYNKALALARATVVTYLSQSPEFLADVQITAQHPAGPQHWLALI